MVFSIYEINSDVTAWAFKSNNPFEHLHYTDFDDCQLLEMQSPLIGSVHCTRNLPQFMTFLAIDKSVLTTALLCEEKSQSKIELRSCLEANYFSVIATEIMIWQ